MKENRSGMGMTVRWLSNVPKGAGGNQESDSTKFIMKHLQTKDKLTTLKKASMHDQIHVEWDQTVNILA